MTGDEEAAGQIALVPIGGVEQSLLNVIGRALAREFGRAWTVISSLDHPHYAYNQRRGQYLSDAILSRLQRVKSPCKKLLGVVDLDLYTSGLNFVFGQASMSGREALIALPRLRQGFYGLPDDEGLYHERVVKEAIHELGHAYGLGHCSDRHCVMHFSNSLRDTDVKRKEFCALCRRRLDSF